MDALIQDLRYAIRNLAARPGFALLMIGCLAVGIGVNSTIFSVVDTIAIRPLPFTDPEALVVPRGTQPASGTEDGGVSYPDLQDWIARTRSFTAIAATSGRSFTITVRGESERFQGSAVTANLFPMLGIQPMLGRGFRSDEDQFGAPDVVLLSHGLWQRKFLGDSSILGQTITINGRAHTVVGVMPPRFQFPGTAQLWVPVTPLEQKSARGNRSLSLVARLAPGASLDTAHRDLAAAASELAASYKEDEGWSATAVPLREELMPLDALLIVFTMMGAVSLVLLIACANVANLLLARATARQREIAVRTALGAGRGRIIRQLLTESVLVGLASAPLGIALAYVGLRMLMASVPPDAQLPYYINWDLNWRIVTYIGAVAVLTGLVFGLAPALQAADRNLHHSLKDGGRGTATSAQRNRTRNLLVIVEIALSLILLVGASLFVRSFLALQRADAGIDTGPLMTMRYFMSNEQYGSPEAMSRRTDDIVQRIEALPGVQSAFASNFVPLSGGGGDSAVATDLITPEPGRERTTTYFGVTSHALTTLGVPLLAGRDFTIAEGHQRSRVAIVNRIFATQFFPAQADVVGQRFRLLADPQQEWFTIIGLVGDITLWTVLDNEPTPFVFVPYPYMAVSNTGLTIRVSGGPPAAITSLVREEIRKADPLLPMFSPRTGDVNRALTYWQERLFGWMFSIFGGVALLLAAIGIYGVLSYSVAQRTQEIGVRMALGASRGDVFGLVLRQGMRLAGIGILIGVVVSFGVTRIVRSFLYNVTPTDPLSFIGTAIFLAVIAIFAGYLPARRATAVDPIIALRAE